MADTFENHDTGLDSPAENAAAVTPADTALTNTPRALYVGTGGDVVVYMKGSTTAITFANVPGGTWLPLRVDQVRAATDASDIVAVW